MKILLLLLSAALPLAVSCATVDVGKSAGSPSPGRVKKIKNPAPETQAPAEPRREIIFVERPVFVPEKDALKDPPPSGTDAVRKAAAEGTVKPSEYSRAAMVYDYDPDFVYEVYAMPLRVCDIALEPDERAAEPPFISDSGRWMLGAGVHYENGKAVQHIYVKPTEPALEASLVINTDRRAYHIILRSYNTVHMPMVKWRYPAPAALPVNYIAPFPQADEAKSPAAEPFLGPDPRSLSFNYRITYGLFRKPAWLPKLAFDDGSKTYIAFPQSVLKGEYPAVFENRKDILNYRVNDNVIVIDKLVENITVKLERDEITISRKRKK